MNSINGRRFLFNISKIIFILFFTYSCTILPGINKDPKKQSLSDSISASYSINDVEIDIIIVIITIIPAAINHNDN